LANILNAYHDNREKDETSNGAGAERAARMLARGGGKVRKSDLLLWF
jgi:hypothetical protein